MAFKKYSIKFKKAYQSTGWGSWEEVTDACLLSTLSMLKRKYNFEIVSTKFCDSFGTSKIVIRCAKSDKNLIFSDYCAVLSGQIEHVSF